MSAKNPHDSLFRDVFGQVEHAGPGLRAMLRAELAAAIDWSTLAPVPGTFVDQDLRQQHTDNHLRESPHARSLPLIVPVVLHHSETGWRHDARFSVRDI